MKLTKSKVDRLRHAKEGNKQHVLWDSGLPGFGVRVYPSGRKAFVISYRVDGRKHIATVGPYGALTLDQARDRAKKKLALTLDNVDPLEARRKAAQGETVADLCRAYLERYAPRKKSQGDDRQRINKYIVPRWGRRMVASIKRQDVATLHGQIGREHPYLANRVVRLLSKMFNLARVWGFLDETAPNPAKGIDMFKEVKRDRWVTPEELPRLAQAMDQEENLYARYALWLYLLTGLRRSELLHTRWDDISWDRKELRLEDTKAGRTHYAPLSEPAIALLRALPKLDGNPYIIPGGKDGQHMVNIDHHWRRVRKAAGVEEVRLHDLRRTVGSWMAQSGNSLHLIGRVLNHTNPSTTAVYARFGQDSVRGAIEEHGKRIMGVAGKLTSGDIVPLSRSERA